MPARLKSPLPALPSLFRLSDGRTVPLEIKAGRKGTRQSRLTVRSNGVCLSIPPPLTQAGVAHALRFMEAQRAWLESQVRQSGGALTQGLLENGQDTTVALRGHAVPLVWHVGTPARAQLVGEGEDEEIHVWLPAQAAPGVGRSVIRQWMETQLRRDIAGLLRKWLPTIPGGAVSHLALRTTSGQWGSMSSSKRLALSGSLIGARPAALEYVLVHELCHQLHMDHSPAFWREVGRRLPRYERETEYFKRMGSRIQAMWAQLG